MSPRVREILDQLRKDGHATGDNDRRFSLDVSIAPEEGGLITGIIDADSSVTRTLEVGCALGIASMHICDALASRRGAQHTVIDAFQSTQWANAGVRNLQACGLGNYRLIEELSELALPRLLSGREPPFDLVFIDGWHTFDHTMIDCFYANRLLKVGGYLIIDDAHMPSVRRAIDYFSSYPAYSLHAKVDLRIDDTLKRKMGRLLCKLAGRLRPQPVLHPSFIQAAREDATLLMVALKKTREDDRSWDWFPAGF